MRFAPALLLVLGACGRGGLPLVPPPDAGVAMGGAGGGDTGGVPVPPLDWSIAVGQPTSPTTEGFTTAAAVIAVSDGGAIVAGIFGGSVSFAPDKRLTATDTGAAFIARYRKDRQLVWVTPLSAASIAVADMAALGSDEVAVAGWFEGVLISAGTNAGRTATSAGGQDAFIVRVAADGSIRWMTRAGGRGDDIARGIAARAPLAANGPGPIAIVISGAVGDAASFGNPDGLGFPPPAPGQPGPVYAARLDGEGNFAWASFAGSGVPGQGHGVALDPTGGVLVTGYVNGLAGFGTTPAGTAVSINPAEGRGFVARWDADGEIAWAVPLAGPDGDGKAVAVAVDGAIVVAGQFEGRARFGTSDAAPTLIADAQGQPGAYLAGFSPEGRTRWARRLTGVGVWPWRTRFAPNGDLLVAGSFGGGIVLDPDGPRPTRMFSRGSDDVVFARATAEGELLWAAAEGGLGDDEAADITGARDGSVWGVGSYVGPARFGTEASATETLPSGTDGAGFLAHYVR